MIDPVAAMNAVLSELKSLAGAAAAPSTASLVPNVEGGSQPSFMDALKNALSSVDNTVADANTRAKAFAAGDNSIPLSDVMVSMEQANLALQMASGVRDKVVAAYTNIMNMQV
ncbi:MAG TPA: flagellar hook-basal body complex protein FliE [Stellaceae bacterium]|nr:flagellar hook-basal body complex protein FliE [Stellaceae bacterium]